MADIDSKNVLAGQAAGGSDGQQDVAALLYKQNAELAVRNKTLSLLRKLYQISILTLDPEVIAEKITQAIQQDLSFEMVGILTLDPAKNELTPLRFSRSERFHAARKSVMEASLHSISIPTPSKNNFFNPIVEGKMMAAISGLLPIWGGLVPHETLVKIEEIGLCRGSLVYPLIIEEKVTGVLIMCMNRSYETLSKFEKESIESFINVIAVALDRAFIYQQLKAANAKLQELDKVKSEFLSFASHQVKTPMSVVKGYASLIYDGLYGPVPQGVKDTAQKIKDSADKMVNLVNDLLDMRKLDEGKMDFRMEEIDINSFVSSIVEELKTLANAKGLQLTFETTVGAKVKADPQKFRQVIQNYTENSIKYTPSGWVKVSIDADPADPKNIIIAVTDSGLGMKPELMPKLFQQFSRDKGDTGVKILGTGLGLFIAKKIVEGHGGTTWAESDGEGKGSRFYVKIAKI